VKFKVEFEMPKYHCLNCPLLDIDDCCKLQPDFDEEIETTWEELMSECPLEVVE